MIDVKKELIDEVNAMVKNGEFTETEGATLINSVQKNVDIIREWRENGLSNDEIKRLLGELYLYGR